MPSHDGDVTKTDQDVQITIVESEQKTSEEKDGSPVVDSNPTPPKRSRNEMIEAAIKNKSKIHAEASVDGSTTLWNTLRIESSEWYNIPWTFCSSLERIESLLRDACADAEDMLDKISKRKYKFECSYQGEYIGVVVPEIYDDVITAGWDITFYPGADGGDDGDNSDPDRAGNKMTYQNKVKYTIDCFKSNPDGGKDFMWTFSSDQPSTFEYESDLRGEIPVMEEKKTLDCSPASLIVQPSAKSRGTLKRPQNDNVSVTTLIIHSPYLLNVLKSIIKYHTTQDSYATGTFYYPYMDLFGHRVEIEDYKTNPVGTRSKHSEEYQKQCNQHIDILLQYLDAQSRVQYARHTLMWKKPKAMTTFAGLWLLLKPCTDVYVQEGGGKLNAFVVDRIEGGMVYPSETTMAPLASAYCFVVWNLHFDGKVLYRKVARFRVPYFDGEREITSLPLFPAHFLDRTDDFATQRELIERGKKYFSYCKGPTFLEYSGPGLKAGWKSYKRARVVVDHSTKPWTERYFVKYGENVHWHLTPDSDDVVGEQLRAPQCECITCNDSAIMGQTHEEMKFSDYEGIDPAKQEELSDHQYMLLASHMYAFILQDREYDLVEVRGLREPMIVEDAINRLVMDETNKGVIKAIARTYTEDRSDSRFNADFIRGKGEGQILLLHGPPGTGKTLTAESVAEYTRRPLLNLTAADLGEDTDKLEENLMRFFRMANDWDAVVLIDEADVYLEARSTENLKRNGVVSMFLRALDYFRGILFLTTNRVGRFDEAFMTRIHVAIGYERLNDAARERIWDNLFDKLIDDFKRGGPQIDYDRYAKRYVKQDEDVKALQWNGREIRNAFQTAVALAVNDSKDSSPLGSKDSSHAIPEIKEKHLEQVVKLSTAFKKYMKATRHNKDESENAYYYGNRDDEANTRRRERREPAL